MSNLIPICSLHIDIQVCFLYLQFGFYIKYTDFVNLNNKEKIRNKKEENGVLALPKPI